VGKKNGRMTRYYCFIPVLGRPEDFPIDVTDPDKLALMRQVAYMNEPEQQGKVEEIAQVLNGEQRWTQNIKHWYRQWRGNKPSY